MSHPPCGKTSKAVERADYPLFNPSYICRSSNWGGNREGALHGKLNRPFEGVHNPGKETRRRGGGGF